VFKSEDVDNNLLRNMGKTICRLSVISLKTFPAMIAFALEWPWA